MTPATGRVVSGPIAVSLDQLLSHPFFRGPIGALLLLLAFGAWESLVDIQREQERQSGGIAALSSDVGALKADFVASKQATTNELIELRARFDLLETRFATHERASAQAQERWEGQADRYDRDAATWDTERAAKRRRGQALEGN